MDESDGAEHQMVDFLMGQKDEDEANSRSQTELPRCAKANSAAAIGR